MGLVQGLSEFLPISSSGHLVLFGDMMEVESIENSQLLLSVVAHLGTLTAVVIYFRKEVMALLKALPSFPGYVFSGFKSKDEESKCPLIFYIIMGTIPAAVFGLTCKEFLEEHFFNKTSVCIALACNAIVLWSSKYTKEKSISITLKLALLIGVAQALAIIPGISRSGSTIVLALWLGISRTESTDFSFLLSIPVILGASILEFRSVNVGTLSGQQILNLSGAFIAAAVSGYVAIKVLTYIVQKNRFEIFAIYCLLVSAVGLAMVYM